ncbi:NEW3 domain-containing protein [Dactylosporangium sp. CA-233914]|uniref:golvesin C-terminal-like domain-containing protein n=1 Tax=Dactylosporangium sp. CA-233914 TaxID=3239934 RepID=UPI003D91C0DC
MTAKDPALSRRSVIRLLVGSAALAAVSTEFAAAEPAAAEPTVAAPPPDVPLRDLPKPGLRYERLTSIAGRNHRVTFWQATWDDPAGRRVGAIVRDLEVAHAGGWLTACGESERFDEQWLVVAEDRANLIGFGNYGVAAKSWLAVDSVRKLSPAVAELTARVAGLAELTVRWTVDRPQPELQWTLEVHRDSNYVVGYQSGAQHEFDAVDEVMCGALQHAKVIGSPTALLAWELFAPMSLIQSTAGTVALTSGTFVPSEVLLFEHERTLGWDQPFGMSLRNLGEGIQTCVYAPPGGARSALKAGDRIGYAFGVLARPGTLYDAYVALAREEYGLERYRRNVYDTSLTGAIHNMIDLISIEPDGDDSVDFVPSLSGWWDRAKGFVNIEADQQSRTAAGSVVLGAGLVASRPQEYARLWERRARPMIEYIVSRHDFGYSPKAGFGNYPLGGWYGDVNTIGPAALMLRGTSGGMNQLAMDSAVGAQAGSNRSPWSVALSAYLVSGDEAWLTQAVRTAKWYARTAIDAPYTTNVPESQFGAMAVKAWLELQVLYEITGDREMLQAATKEARRYLGLFMVRPVPEGLVTSPVGNPVDFTAYSWKVSPGIPQYELTTPPSERVEKWVVSTTGQTFEQLTTLKIVGTNPGGGLTRNPIWAPFLARLAHQSGDTYMRDLTHNMVTGRFTSYPGYYDRQFVSWPLHPDYPLRGPFGLAAIYYHHTPAQLGLAVDYLISEHHTRSDGRIDFPYTFEAAYLYFKYHVYGHAPGTFYGDDGVWPYFPKGIVAVSDSQLNWLTAVSAQGFYVSLTNASPTTRSAWIAFDPELTGIDAARTYRAEVIADGRRYGGQVAGARIKVQVCGHGITAIKIPGAGRLAPWHHAPGTPDRSGVSFHVDDLDGSADTTNDQIRAMALPRPDRSGYDVYVSTGLSQPVSLRYRIGDGAWQDAPAKPLPYEWTIGVDDLRAGFSYQASVNGLARPQADLYLPGTVTGALPPGRTAGGELSTQASATPSATLDLTVTLRNATGAALDGTTVTLTAPSGWTVTSDTPPPATLPGGAVATAKYKVTVAANAAPGDTVITGTLGWAGPDGSAQHADLTETRLKVIAPLASVGVTASASTVEIGKSATVTAAYVNRSPMPQSGTLRVSVPIGWTVQPTTIPWTIPGGALAEFDLVVQPGTAATGISGTVFVNLGGGAALLSTSLRLVNPDDLIITPGDQGYSEAGAWLQSGLPGYGGSGTRYSPPETYGPKVTWRPPDLKAGTYQVSVWYPTNADTTKDALYTVSTATGRYELHVDQTDRAGQWRELGVFDLEPGAGVTLTAISGLYTRANACRFTRR